MTRIGAVALGTLMVAGFFTGCAPTLAAQATSDRAGFLNWAGRSLAPIAALAPTGDSSDLAVFREIVGDARIVALAEGVHAGAEPLVFRNRLLEFLVEEMGFTAIAIESGIVEGRLVHDYVLGSGHNLADVLADGVSWTFDQFPQNAALIRWLREYNMRPGIRRKVNFYGFDAPGSPGNHLVKHGVRTALDEVMRHLDRVDPAAHEAFQDRLSPLLPNLRVNFQDPNPPGYAYLSQSERDQLTSAIADLVALMGRQEAEYSANSSAVDYKWAYRAVIGARQVDDWLRQIPLGWRAADGLTVLLPDLHAVRDRAQIENLEWIIQEEGSSGKVLVFASNFHVSAAPLTIWGGSGQQVMGTYAKRRFDADFVTIGNVIGQASAGCGAFQVTMSPASQNSMDAIAGELGVPQFVLDLRPAPDSVAEWLKEQRAFGPSEMEVSVSRAFDVLLYMDTSTAACPP